VKEIVRLGDLQANIQPADAAAFSRKAPVSRNEMAENWRADQMGLTPLPHWRDSLERYMKKAGLARATKK
jgi:dTDP-4-dehydrorhamnose reductase